MAAGVCNVNFYATMGRKDTLAEGLADMLAPPSIKYGATKYQVLRSRDDRYSLKVFFWFNSHDDWYRFWEGEEANEFRARYSGQFQVPLTYTWHDEIASEADVPGTPTHVSPEAEVLR